jgi:hypothetical protein
MSEDEGPRMIYLGAVDAADTIIIPHAAFAAAEQELDAERARQKAETEKAKQQVLESVRTSGKLRRLLGLSGD